MAQYDFRPVEAGDLPLLCHWQAEPHVARWWDDDDPPNEADLADARVAQWIVTCDGTAFAFMQDYDPHGWEAHHLGHLPEGTRGIDQYIGEPGYLGLGHGQGFIKARMAALFAAGAPAIGVDPHPDNAHAILVYQKLGFEAVEGPRQTEWGPVLVMVARPD